MALYQADHALASTMAKQRDPCVGWRLDHRRRPILDGDRTPEQGLPFRSSPDRRDALQSSSPPRETFLGDFGLQSTPVKPRRGQEEKGEKEATSGITS